MNNVLVNLDGRQVNVVIESGGLGAAASVDLAALASAVADAEAAEAAAAAAAAEAVAATINKADRDGSNLTGGQPASFRTAIGAVGSVALAATGGAGLVGYGGVTMAVREAQIVFATEPRFGGGLSGLGDPSKTAQNNAALAAAVAYCVSSGSELWLPAGDYYYSVSPNFGVTGLVVKTLGRVRMYYTGTGNALIFDAGTALNDQAFGVYFAVGNPIEIYAPATAGNGVYNRSVHHSDINARVFGCGAAAAGLLVEFAVCTVFGVTVSENEGGWYAPGGVAAKPAVGVKLSRRVTSDTAETQETSYCTFINPVIEGPTIGIYLDWTYGNIFNGGTSEKCATYNVFADTNAKWDKFYGTDFEGVTTADINCGGLGIEFHGCDTDTYALFSAGARRCLLVGGGHKSVELAGGAAGCTIRDIAYNRLNNGGYFADGGTGTEIANVRLGVAPYTQYLTGSLAVPLSAGVGFPGSVSADVTVTDVKAGDTLSVGFTTALSSFQITAQYHAANTVRVVFNNITGAAADRLAGTIKVRGSRGS